MPGLEAEVQRARLINMYFEKSEDVLTEADVIEKMYSKEELAQNLALQTRYECLKRDEALAVATTYIARARDNGIPVPEELVRLHTHCEEILKQNEQLTKECDRLRRQRDRAKRTSLLPIEQRTILRILGVITANHPYNFDLKPKNTATKMICDMAARMGLIIDEGSALRWLRQAAMEVLGCRE